MLASIWAFLQDDSNRPVPAWIGGAVFKFFVSEKKKNPPAPIGGRRTPRGTL
jgi:hypothetical protein